MAEELTLKSLLTPEGQAQFHELYNERQFAVIAEFIQSNIAPDIKISLVQQAANLGSQFRFGSEHAQAIHFLSNHARFALTGLQPSSQPIKTARHHDENFPVWPLAALHAFYSNVESFEQRFIEGNSHKIAVGNPQLVFVPADVVEAAFYIQHGFTIAEKPEEDITPNQRHEFLTHILPRNPPDSDVREVLGAVHYALHDTFPVNDAKKRLHSGVVISIAEIIPQAIQVEQEELGTRNLLTADYQRPADQEFLKTWVKAIADACYWHGTLGDNYNARLMDKGEGGLLLPLDPQEYPQDNQLLAVIARDTASKSFIM
jgi:hypothetical protein